MALGNALLPIGIPNTIVLPSQQSPTPFPPSSNSSTSATFAAIYVDWLPSSSPTTIFLSFRLSSSPFDLGTPGFSDGLLMHSYSGTVQSDYSDTRFIGSVAATDAQSDPASGGCGVIMDE